MNRITKLVILTNDALGIAASDFALPIYKMTVASQTMESVSSIERTDHWQLKTRIVSELKALNPDEVYSTLPERLAGLPLGYSWKIAELNCLYEGADSLHYLEFKRDTVHTRFSTSGNYQNYITTRMNTTWEQVLEYYRKVDGLEIKYRKPSMLVLEKVDGSEELATNPEFLLYLISHLYSDKNPLSKGMYELVWKIKTQTGVWEYSERT